MGRQISVTITLDAAVDDGYALSQARGSAGLLTLNGSLVSGGVGRPDSPRLVAVTSAGDDSGITWTITGTSRPELGGGVQVEVIQGANADVASTTQDFATVTSIRSSGAAAGNVTAGTSAVGSTPWVPWDVNVRASFNVGGAVNVLAGSPTWQLEVTQDDVFLTSLPANVPFPRPFVWNSLSGKTDDEMFQINQVVRASRLTLTVVGSVQLTQSQQGD